MPPIPAPEEEQIEIVREIARLLSYTETETLVNALNDVQWSKTTDNIDEWEVIRDKYLEIKNGLLGANKNPEKRKLAVTNRVRERLGLSPVNMSGMSWEDGYSQSIAVETVF